MPNDIQAIQDTIIQEFAAFDNWDARYEHIIKMGKTLSPLPEEVMTEKYRVEGCQSQVWIKAKMGEDGLVHYQGSSDAIIVKGLVALVLRVYSDQSPKTVVETAPRFMEEIGMSDHLSMTRRNGLAAMLKQLKLYATVLMLTQNP